MLKNDGDNNHSSVLRGYDFICCTSDKIGTFQIEDVHQRRITMIIHTSFTKADVVGQTLVINIKLPNLISTAQLACGSYTTIWNLNSCYIFIGNVDKITPWTLTEIQTVPERWISIADRVFYILYVFSPW